MAAHCVCYGYFLGCELRDSHRVLNMACCNLFNVCKSGLLVMPREMDGYPSFLIILSRRKLGLHSHIITLALICLEFSTT
jgi:hypothetical protein